MGSGFFNIGITGLNAANVGLNVASHNIANANTEGYRRQTVAQATLTALPTGNGYIGQGTQVENVQRAYNQFLSARVLSADTGAHELSQWYTQIQQIDNLLADPNAGLSPALQSFFSGVQEASANPSLLASRQALLSSANALVARFNSLDQRMSEMRDAINNQLDGTVGLINSYASQIAEINEAVVQATAASQGRPPNDLLDQRDQLVAKLNQEVRVSTVTQTSGSISVFIGNGQPLVTDRGAATMTVQPSNDDNNRYVLALSTPSGNALLPESLLSGGNLGGQLKFRSETLDAAQNALGRLAVVMAESINAQHRLGQDLNGNAGGDLLKIGSSYSWPYSVTGMPGLLNSTVTSETVTATISDASKLTTSDYRLSYASGTGTYTLTRLSDSTQWSNANLATLATTADQGFSLATSAVPDDGDTFLIQPTRFAARNVAVAITDTRLVAAAAPMRAAAAGANTGGASINAGSVNAPPPQNASIQNTVTITFTSATTFDVVDTTAASTLASGVAYTSGNDISYNGWTYQISGPTATGDVFTVSANTNGDADNRNMLAIAALQTSRLVEGRSNFQAGYAQLVSDIGNKARELQVTSAAQIAYTDEARLAEQSYSGVNLDEEAANLIRFQQAYQASARMIDVAGRLFDEVLSLGR